MAAHSTPTLQNHFAAHVGAKWHAQKFDQNAKIVCRGTRVGKYGEFGAWRRTKFDGELNIKEKIKRIMGWRGIGSRIQGFHWKPVPNRRLQNGFDQVFGGRQCQLESGK
jgi:hypothetical protein